MPYGNNSDSVSRNINYISRDFLSIKNDLINYVKTYFPNTYQDFNETSTGMMMLELSAYVGDVLNFYIDEQFKETLLPTVQEKRNVINIANTMGYKVKSTVPSVVNLNFKLKIPHNSSAGDDPRVPDYSKLLSFDRGIEIQSLTDSNVAFQTLDTLDFFLTGSNESELIPSEVDSDGLTKTWTLNRNVLAVSGKTKVKQVNISSPKQFLKINITDKNVINIQSVVDSNGNNWNEVDYLAQDKIFNETVRHGSSAYSDGNSPVKSLLSDASYTDKRFITQLEENGSTSLIFGNGLLSEQYNNNTLTELNNQNQDLNALINNSLPTSLSNVSSNFNQSLGEAPSNTTLTITYRVGGGIESNVPSGDLQTIINADSKYVTGDSSNIGNLSVTNSEPARGGMDEETVEQIKEKAKAFITSQYRAVTKEDYESRISSMPSRFGSISKVYVNRRGYNQLSASSDSNIFSSFDFDGDGSNGGVSDSASFAEGLDAIVSNGGIQGSGYETKFNNMGTFISNLSSLSENDLLTYKNLDCYFLSYDKNKHLVKTTDTIKNNVRSYINNYKTISDELALSDGVVINFGIYFSIEALPSHNRSEVKLKVIEELKKYFDVENMKFNQAIYTDKIKNMLFKNVDGIKTIHQLFLTQDKADLNLKNHLYARVEDGTGVTQEGVPADGVSGPTATTYGHAYITEFKNFYTNAYNYGVGVILPPNVDDTPGVFELKNPNENIKGVVH